MAAGLGFKTFTTGEVLTAADTNGYLMQGVLVFASAAARDAAITSPQEGQCCYLKDTDAVLTYSGTAWVGFDDSNAIQNTIVDAKGDIVAASGSDTPARLAVGNNGETLVADSSTSTGLRYIPLNSAGKNTVINGGMDVWQRGTTSADSAGSPYTADRWQMFSSGVAGRTTTRQATGDTTNLPTIQYCARVQRNSGNTSTNGTFLAQNVETVNSIPLASKTVTVSFYARKGANYSAASDVLSSVFVYGTGTDQNVATGLTGQTTVVSASNTLTATWQRFTMTGTVAATATQVALYYTYTPVGTAGANDYFEITGVQLELGSTATTFSRAGGTIQGELAACQRYYYRNTDPSGTEYMGTGQAMSTTVVDNLFTIPVTMRTDPTTLETSNMAVYATGATRSGGTFTLLYTGPNTTTIRYTHGSAVFTNGNAAFLLGSAAPSYVGLSAEL